MKIRTDFVTNSSSSSFMLVIRIGLKNGEVLKFMGDGGVGEGDEQFYKLAAMQSPEQLGASKSIEELITRLKRSIVENNGDRYFADRDSPYPVIVDDDEIIEGLRKLSSMDEIARITINGDLYGLGDQHQYWHYTYDRERDVTVYDEGGEDVVDEGTGGAIMFCPGGRMTSGVDYGEAGGYDDYYDDDVEAADWDDIEEDVW